MPINNSHGRLGYILCTFVYTQTVYFNFPYINTGTKSIRKIFLKEPTDKVGVMIIGVIQRATIINLHRYFVFRIQMKHRLEGECLATIWFGYKNGKSLVLIPFVCYLNTDRRIGYGVMLM